MKADEFEALTFLEKVKAYVDRCGLDVPVEPMDPGILSDIGTEGLVFDKYIVYLAREHEYVLFTTRGACNMKGYHVWSESGQPGSQPNVVEHLTTQVLEDAIMKCIEVVIKNRMASFKQSLVGDEEG